ncbi:MAG: Ig-like domain-containing protein [Nocardioidaceae bacterium]
MRLRAHLLAASSMAALLLTGATVAPAGADPSPPATAGTVRGMVSDVDGGVDLTFGAHPVLYVWQGGAFVPSSTSTLTQDGIRGHYAFSGLAAGFYTVRVLDNSGTYVAETWPSATGAKPTTTSDPGVREVPAASSSFEPTTIPPLDVQVLRQLSNEGAAPDVTGLRRVGYRLSAGPGVWNVPVETMTFGYQWQRVDSRGTAADIPGATGPSYVLTPDETGNGVRIRVTGQRPGYAPENGYSDETEVKRGYSATAVRLAFSRIRTTARGRVRVTVTPSTLAPTGKVTVRIDGRNRVATTLRSTHLGSVALALPRLSRGQHRVVAIYAGFRGLYGSTSRGITLTVVR